MWKIIKEFNKHMESSLYYIFENLKSCKIKGLNDTRLVDNNDPLLEILYK